MTASASGAARTTASRWRQNSGSPVAVRISARNGWTFAKVRKISPCAARNASPSIAPPVTIDAAMSQ
jgi:hypothetical protein